MFPVLGRTQSIIRGINGNADVYEEMVIFSDPLNVSFFILILMKQFHGLDNSIEGGKCSVFIAVWEMGVLIFSSFTKKHDENINSEC